MKLFIIILMFLIQIKLNLSLKYQGINCYVLSQSYEITIKLRGKGVQNIINENYNSCPNLVYLNDEEINTLTDKCYQVEIPEDKDEENTLKLIWNTITNSLANIFEGLNNIEEVDLSNFDTSSIIHMSQMFMNCESITSINFKNIKTSLVEDMRLMFAKCYSIIELDLSPFDTSKVIDMHFMFSECRQIKNLNISNFITDNVVHMEGMFSNMHSLENLYLNFDTSKVMSMHGMFAYCNSLTSLDISMFNTSSVTDMSYMFTNNNKFISLDLSNFDTSKVTLMNNMFEGCSSITSYKLSSFITSSATDMSNMFRYNTNLQSLDLFNFDTSKVTLMNGMFYGCYYINFYNLSSFNTSSVVDMTDMFRDNVYLQSLNLSNFDTSSVTSLNSMFRGMQLLNTLDVSNFNTKEVVNMDYMFHFNWNLRSLNLSNFQTPKLKSMNEMFGLCLNLISLDISNFDTKQITNMQKLFSECNSISKLDLSSFDTSNVITMSEMFSGCNNLASLDISSFNTSSVIDLSSMFSKCNALNSLDLSHFDTSKVTKMNHMFFECIGLQKLNINNFDTHLVENMESLFSCCRSLTSIDLSSFDTSKVTNMNSMFYDNYKMKELNLSNFVTSLVNNNELMFCYCFDLEYINFPKYNEIDGLAIRDFMNNIRENVVVCINEGTNQAAKFLEFLDTKRCPTIYCGDDWKSKQKKFVFGVDGVYCAQDCSNYKYEHNDWCYPYCPEGVDFCTPGVENEETTTIPTNDNHKDTNAINDSSGENEISQTSNYLTDNLSTYKNSIYLTENVNISPTSNFVTENFSSSQNSLYRSSIPKDYSLTNLEMSTIINSEKLSDNIEQNLDIRTDEDNNSMDSTNNIEYNISIENNEILYQEIVDNILKNYSISEGKEKIIEGTDNYIYIISTSDIGKSIINGINDDSDERVSKIDLGECENILKDHYYISRNDSLIIIIFEKLTNISTERSLQYEVYEPYNKTKLNLSLCDNVTIITYVPVILSEKLQNLYNELQELGYDLFDINGAFYQDICTPYTSPEGTDVLLTDRINYYYNNNETLCQSNCKFSDYLMESQYLKCVCDTSNSEIDNKQIKKFKPKAIYESFYDTLKFSNYKVLLCYKLAFHVNSLTVNIGSIIAIIYFCIHLSFSVIYYNKGIRPLKLDIAKVIIKKPKLSNDAVDKKDNIKDKNEINNKDINYQSNPSKNATEKKLKILDIYDFPPKKNRNISSKNVKFNINNIKKNSDIPSTKFSEKDLIISNKIFTIDKSNEFKTEKKNSDSDILNNTNQQILDNFELNNLNYDSALQLDKRNFIEMYWSILKREHLIIFTFFIRNDHNLIPIKFSRFIFSVCTDMALNVFFFSDETMHKMYIDYGKYNFLQQIPQIVYSTLVSQLIDVFLCFLSLTDKHYYQIKDLKLESKYTLFKIIKCVKIKIIIFYTFTFLMFAFYWYTIACFCAVYVNSQKAFITDSITSFGLALLYPFILYLFPACFRFISLKANKARLTCIYATSDIIPFF